MTCSVKGCGSVRRLCDENISFHRFPREPGNIQKAWVNALALGLNPSLWTWTRAKYVCSKHFRVEDYIQPHVLKSDAVPSLCLHISVSNIRGHDSRGHLEALEVTGSSTLSVESIGEKNISISTSSSSSGRMPKRRKHANIDSSSTDKSTDSSSKRRRIQLVKKLHNYSISPSKLKNKSAILAHKQRVTRKKLYTARYKSKQLKEKVSHLNTVIMSLQKHQLLSEHAIDHLQKSYADVPAMLMARHLKNIQNQTITHETFPGPLREFAATLNFYSNKAYEHVREHFSLALPHQSTLRKWFANVDCSPGFMTPVFDTLKLKSEEAKMTGRELICSLMLDEISIRKQIEFDGKGTWGYVNIGVPTQNDELQPASEALVVMVVGLQQYWKLPIAYFFIKGLSAKEKVNIVNESLRRLYEHGVTITSLTCDGPSANFTMFKELGCNFENVLDMRTHFKHPSNSAIKVFAMLDACHMLKLVRNSLADLKSILDPDGKRIDWSYIRKLHAIQEEESLSFGNKIKTAHIEFFKQKMKVYLAAQTFSRSTADALMFLSRRMNLPEFRDCEATVKFIRTINDLFDVLNSRNPYHKGFKGPLRERNEQIWRSFLMETVNYILRCTDVAGRPLCMTPKKTPFLGLAISSLSVCGIFDEYVRTTKLNYILTYKFSQDHLESFFCAIRSRNGWNNNPSALQFMRTIRKLLLLSKISGKGGNCKVLDSTTILTVASSQKTQEKCLQTVDVGLCRKYGIDATDTIYDDHDYGIIEDYIPLTELTRNVVTYMSGFVVRMLSRKTHCMKCILGCTIDRKEVKSMENFQLLCQKDRGGLTVPSEGVIQICLAAEGSIRRIMNITNNKVPSEKDFFVTLTLATSQKFYKDVDRLFPKLTTHFSDAAPDEEHHG